MYVAYIAQHMLHNIHVLIALNLYLVFHWIFKLYIVTYFWHKYHGLLSKYHNVGH